ncbi:hypothetical protein [Luteolibacter sp. Populi]|uniref:hypothetical protein n=1 Tax=Luteolibacter sp. Populi TaxID=3230487 RepID=UPI003465CADF
MTGPGSRVKFEVAPDWVASLSESSQQIFAYCAGKPFTVQEIDENGLCVLDVSGEVDRRFGGYANDLRLEIDSLTKVGQV